MRVKYNPDTKLYFLIGDPMSHSCTALVNNTMFERAGQNAVCIPVTVPKGKLPEFIKAAKLLGVAGFYLTMPHKEDIISHLDECDAMSEKFRSVNHVKIVDGKLIGIGLDGLGMGISIEKEAGALENRSALMIGAGSVAGPIAADLCGRGIKKLMIANRTIEKAEMIANLIEEIFPDVEVICGRLENSFLSECAQHCDIAVQCTSLGMNSPDHADFESLQFVEAFSGRCLAADVLYPTSSFLEKAKACGLKTINGIWMTLNQQKEIMKFQFGVNVTDKDILEAEEAFRIAITVRELREERFYQ